MLLFYTSIALIALAVGLFANTFFSEDEKYRAQEKLEDVAQKEKSKNIGIVIQVSRPFFKRYVTPIVSNLKNKKKIRDTYKKPLANAGLTTEVSPDDFFAFKLFLILGFPFTYLILRSFLELYDWPVSGVFAVSVLGFFYPDIWIRGKIQQRQKELIESMPFVVDLLALSVEAGLDFIAAISRVIQKAPPSALTEEFTILMKEIKVGASRAEALRNMAWRTNIIEMASFCATLIAADSVGASIGPILKVLSGDMRQKRSSLIEKAGATAATKILFPTIFLIIPAVFIIIAAPLAFQAMAGK